MKNKKKKISNNSKILWKILNLEQKRWFIVISLMMIIGMLLEMIGIGLVIPAIAILMSPDQLDNFPFVKSISLLIIGNKEIGKEFIILSGLMLFLFFYLFKTIYLTFLTWTQAVYSSSIQRSVAKEVFTKYMKQDYMFHLERNSAQLIQNVNGEVSLFSIAVQSKLTLITEALVLFGISILLIVVQPMGTIAMVFILITFSFLYYFSTKKFVSKLGKERQIHEGLKIQHLQQGLGGIKDVKITGREKLFIDSFNFHNVIHAKIIALITL